MIPSKAYIIRISDEISQEYAKNAADSCSSIELPFEYHAGIENKSSYDAWNTSGIALKPGGQETKRHNLSLNKAACCTVSHVQIWKKILEAKECAIILEHDALMLHKVDIDIPDDAIVTLGYKITEPSSYDHIKAGGPKVLHKIDGHEGAHAYCLTWKTAEKLLKEFEERGVQGVIDNTHFLKIRKTRVPLYIADPTPAIGWIRKSTIWDKASDANYFFIKSFEKHLNRNV